MIATVMITALLFTACGGGNSGKALANQMVAAMKAEDEQKLKELANKIEDLGPLQKVQFATELAKNGADIQKMITEQMGKALGQ